MTMPVLSNPRHERFAQELAKGETADAAYQTAGYSPDRGHASRLAANGSIVARVAELQAVTAAAVVEQTAITRTTILQELAKLATAPTNDEHVRPSVKRAACLDYAKIEGWVIERSEVGAPGDFSRMSEEELHAALREQAQGLDVSALLAQQPKPNGKDTRH